MALLCRLCFSKKYLISLFSGKYRTNREYIRKFILKTTQIDIKEGDCLSTVCINCCIMSCNFYKFKCMSTMNQNTLKVTEKRNISFNTTSPEKVISAVTEELKLFVLIDEWLTKKKKSCFKQKVKKRYNKNINISLSTVTQNTFKSRIRYDKSINQTSDKETQCDKSINHKFDRETQCDKIINLNVTTQTAGPDVRKRRKTHSTSTQTDNLVLHKSNGKVNDQNNVQNNDDKFSCDCKIKTSPNQCQTDSLNLFCQTNSESNILLSPIELPVLKNEFEKDVLNKSYISPSKSLLVVNSFGTDIDHNANGKSLKITDEQIKLDNSVPNRSNTSQDLSPNSNSLLSVRRIIQHVESCMICDRAFYKSGDLKRHLKQHMQCYLCRRKFRTLDATRQHIESQCERRHFTDRLPTIQLTKFEDDKELYPKFPDAINFIMKFKNKVTGDTNYLKNDIPCKRDLNENGYCEPSKKAKLLND